MRGARRLLADSPAIAVSIAALVFGLGSGRRWLGRGGMNPAVTKRCHHDRNVARLCTVNHRMLDPENCVVELVAVGGGAR